MADDIENDDQWLYGENSDGIPEEKDFESQIQSKAHENESDDYSQQDEEQLQQLDKNILKTEKHEELKEDDSHTEEVNDRDTEQKEKQNGEGSDKEDYDEDSDDDVNVVIGDIDIKANSSYTSPNIKKVGLIGSTAKGEKSQPLQPGKFTVEEFDHAGFINGIPISDFNLDSLEDKPWRKPGADITDYFNYGFNEDTWRAYCERQKRMRINESGTGLLPLNAIGMPRGPIPIMNDNSKYSGGYTGIRKAGPPPGRRMTGSIDVIGGAPPRVGATVGKVEPPKENVIQVMTADRREYSRKPGFPDMTVPPPGSGFDEFHPEFDFNPEPEPFYGGYEPTQDCQWGAGGPPSWQPQEIKTLTNAGSVIGPVPPPQGQMNMPPPMDIMAAPSMKDSSPAHKGRSKDREPSIRRDRDRSRDREREKSHRRDRSRSRSRRHKSRSRSPSHRCHRKKKSRRHDDSE